MSKNEMELNRFYDLTQKEWEYRLKENPLFATRVGDHRYDDLMPRADEGSYESRLSKAKEFHSELTGIDSNHFDGIDKLNFEIFEKLLINNIEEMEYKTYRMEMSKVNGIHLILPQLHLFQPTLTLEDFTKFIARLSQIPQFIDDHIEIMRNGIKDGQIAPKCTMEGVTNSFQKQITENPMESPYFVAFKEMPKHLSESDINKLREDVKIVIKDDIYPALEKFIHFLNNEYLPACREDIAAINLPGEMNYYQHCIKYHTSLNLTAKEIHQIGLDEVKRIQSQMKEIMKQVNFEGTIKEFNDSLRTNPQFFVDTPEQLLEKTARILKKIDGELPRLFKTLPRLPYGMKPIPDFSAPGNYTGYYQYGTGDGTRSGTFYVNTYDLKSRPLFEYEALSLHEAVPGHHLQLALQQEIDVPDYRKYGNFTSFVEGWALYSEKLGHNIGLYQSPYTEFGRLSFEMWRACRLVVDTGMHTMGWTRQQAIDFMAENTSLSILNITNEIDRYISWPGQALAYKLGELKIWELRNFAEKKLGNRFDIREFHDAILLNGSLPLDTLDMKIKEWINNLNL